MAALVHRRLELFAQGLARRLAHTQAARDAGYGHSPRASKLRARRPDVVARVAVLTEQAAGGGGRDLGSLIDELIAMAKEARKLNTAAGFTAARGLIGEAARLKGLLPHEDPAPAPYKPRMTTEEWIRKFRPAS